MNHDTTWLFYKMICGSDGEIGRVKDFLLDEEARAIRYLEIDTEGWLPERRILLAPPAFGPHGLGPEAVSADQLRIDLSRAEVETSPVILSNHPVTRIDEEACCAHYGWTRYWKDSSANGERRSSEQASGTKRIPAQINGALRNPAIEVSLLSIGALCGFHLQATDGMIGEVLSFVLHGKSWAVSEMVVEAGQCYQGRLVFILTKDIVAIDYLNSTVVVDLSQEDIEQTPNGNLVEAGGRQRSG